MAGLKVILTSYGTGMSQEMFFPTGENWVYTKEGTIEIVGKGKDNVIAEFKSDCVVAVLVEPIPAVEPPV